MTAVASSLPLVLAVQVLVVLLLLLVAATAARKATRRRQQNRLRAFAVGVRPALLRALADDEPDLDTVDAATPLEGRALVALALELLGKVRGESHSTLVKLLERRGTIEAAYRALHRPGAVRRARAAELLGAVGSTQALPELIRLLGDRRSEVAVVAARALGKLRDPAAVPALLHTLRGDTPLPAGTVAQALLTIGTPGVPELRQGLLDEWPTTRAVSAQLLGLLETGALAAVPDLVTALAGDDAVEVGVRAAEALGRIGGRRTLEPLIAALSPDAPPQLRAAAAVALGRVGSATAVPTLRKALDDPDHDTAHSAGDALRVLGWAGREALDSTARGETTGAAHAREALAMAELFDPQSPSPEVPARAPARAS